jgi:uncharacterized protein
MIIDCHTHASRKNEMELLLKDMEECGIDRSIIMYWPFDDMFTNETSPALEEVIATAKEIGKGKLAVAGAMSMNIDPRYKNDITTIDNALKSRDIVGIKVYLGYEPLTPSDSRCEQLYDLAEKYRVPVIFHTGDTFNSLGLVGYAHPLGVDEVAKRRPGMKIVIAHIGNPWIDDAALMLSRHKNVYADISGMLSYQKGAFEWDSLYERNVAHEIRTAIGWCGGPQKLLFGSDSPIFSQYRYLQFVSGLGLSKEESEKVMHKNAAELFGI